MAEISMLTLNAFPIKKVSRRCFKKKKVQLISKELDSGVYPVMKMIQISFLFFLPATTISNELAYFLWMKK